MTQTHKVHDVAFEEYRTPSGGFVFPETATLIEFIETNIQAATQRPELDTESFRFVDYGSSREGDVTSLVWTEFGQRLHAIAARLQQVAQPGDRVVVLAPQGMDYIVSFFAAIHAGLISVPLFDPDEPGHKDRLHAVLDDCEPSVILTAASSAAGVRELYAKVPPRQRPRILDVDAIPNSMAANWVRPEVVASDIAYLQYTSGSTRTPAGVEITHRNVITNVGQLFDGLGLRSGARGVTWLPLFHDMGLLNVISVAMGYASITVMSPRAFVQRPSRWINALGEDKNPHGVFAAAPNFAFEHAAKRGLPKEGETLDLSGVTSIINGSEPVTTASMNVFMEAFGPYGFKPTSVRPSFGMAEATLFVSSQPQGSEVKVVWVDRDDLNKGIITLVEEGTPNSIEQVSCGVVGTSLWGAIVDPILNADGEPTGKGVELPEGRVGELWIHGDNIGRAYWGRTQETIDTFHNVIQDRLEQDSKTVNKFGEVPLDGKWLRTGDLACFIDGELYITGRQKDLVIADGRNHYPQDLEHTAQEASDALRPGFIAAFSVKGTELPESIQQQANIPAGDAGERLVVVGERGPGAGKLDPEPIIDQVRSTISAHHGVTPADVLLVPAGSIPRTSSGKIARRACKAAYLDATLRGGHTQQAFPDAPTENE